MVVGRALASSGGREFVHVEGDSGFFLGQPVVTKVSRMGLMEMIDLKLGVFSG